MPNYDYVCKECGGEHEETHGMTASPEVKCHKCGSSNTVKAIRACGVITRNSGARSRLADAQKKEASQRQDLSENYGVENITPVGGNSFATAYNDVKTQGSKVRDEMQARRAVNATSVKKKQREWGVKSRARVEERTRVANDKKAEAAQKKRAIKL